MLNNGLKKINTTPSPKAVYIKTNPRLDSLDPFLQTYHKPSMRYRTIVYNPTEINMVSHKRLQQYKRYYGKTFMTGIYGCRWHRYQQSRDSTSHWDVGWFCLLILLLIYCLTWLIYWVAAFNDHSLINEIIIEGLVTSYQDWHRVFLGVTSAIFTYVAILFILALLHAGYGHELYLHYVHKAALVLVLTGCILTTYFTTYLWPTGWDLLYLSILGNWPFIHLTIVVVMTLLTLLIAKRWTYLYSIGARVVSLAVFLAVIVFIYVSPLLVHPPCVINAVTLPPPPRLIAHRGGAAVAPENTLLAFLWSSKLARVSTFECDVQLSSDGVPFLMRDVTLRRTTNISVQFPEKVDRPATRFNITNLTSLNAGAWFLQDDPFNIAGSLTEEERAIISEQTVPTLEAVVNFVKTTNKSLLLHILPTIASDEDVLLAVYKVITSTGINPHQILWPNVTVVENVTLPFSRVLEEPETRFEFLNSSSLHLINLPYKATNFDLYELYESMDLNLSLNLYTVNSAWLYSVCWCAGIESVTTNNVQGLTSLTRPLWVMDPLVYLLLWIVVDVVSACAIVAMFIYHRVKKSGVMFNPETLSLQAMQHRMQHTKQGKTMKEKLLITAESINDLDAMTLRVDSPTSPATTPATIETPTTPVTPNSIFSHPNGVTTKDAHNISYSKASGFFGDNLFVPSTRKEPAYDITEGNGIENKLYMEAAVVSNGGVENRGSGFFDDLPNLENEEGCYEALANGEIANNPDYDEVGNKQGNNPQRSSLNTEIHKFFEGTSLQKNVMDRFEKSASQTDKCPEDNPNLNRKRTTSDFPVNGHHGELLESENVPTNLTPKVQNQDSLENHSMGPVHLTDVEIGMA